MLYNRNSKRWMTLNQVDPMTKGSCCKKAEHEAPPAESMNQLDFTTYVIEGMDCSSCALSIENHLKAHPMVKRVQVHFSSGNMHIEHDNSAEEIMREVRKLGYKAFPASNKTDVKGSAKDHGPMLATGLSGLLLALGYAGSYSESISFLSPLLYALAIMAGGYRPARSAFFAVKSGSLDMNVLMTAAVLGAAVLGEWLEGATVVWLFALGNLLQMKAIQRTRGSIRHLMDHTPPEAWVRHGTELLRKPVEALSVGDIIVLKPGDHIPLDGVVIAGESSVNQAPITGESIPVDKVAGDTVYAGTMNEHGSLEVKVTKLAGETTISRIIHLVEQAQEQKAPAQAVIDTFASVYTPIVFAAALLLMLLPPLAGFGAWDAWFYRGLELLVIACPCALVISTPIAIVSAIGSAARVGVLIKGGAALETAGNLTAIAFDKTGTLTEGKPHVTDIIPLSVSETELLSVARTLEEYSTHPIAAAVVRYAKERDIPPSEAAALRNIPGKGIQGNIRGEEYYAGSLALFQELRIPLHEIESRLSKLQHQGQTIVLVGTAKSLLGLIAVADITRESTVRVIRELDRLGIRKTVMLTGDHEGTARNVAAQSGIGQVHAGLLPEEKAGAITALQREGHSVAMVGDGINDAPALATANLGMAMGGAGKDTAMETADIVLMAENLDKLPYTVALSRRTLAIIKQNIWFSILVKAAALLLILPGWLTLWMAILSDTGAALLVILNSMRLLRYKNR